MAGYPALGFFGSIGGYEWLIILIVALLLFGRRLPEVMRGLGGGVREFRKGIDGSDDDQTKAEKTEKPDQAAPPKSIDQGETPPPPTQEATVKEDTKQS